MAYHKKLIEVSLPLEAINEESAREKSIRHGHPSTLHLWWARRPLAACRAVLWSSLVDDPSEYMPDEESANRERDRLFAILEKLVKWENINNQEVLDAAKLEIARSVARDLGCDVPVGKEAIREFLSTKAPPILDPFAGGGSIPLEAQRLGLRAYASDLNPVAVLINKAQIEIPPKFSGLPPIHPVESGQHQKSLIEKDWKGAEGLAEDVRYYGNLLIEKTKKKIGQYYPLVHITDGTKKLDAEVLAWMWARTVKCPNPACGTQMPLVGSFCLYEKGTNKVWVEPQINRDQQPPTISFSIKKSGKITIEGSMDRTGGVCIACGTPISFNYIRDEGKKGCINQRLMAIICEFKGSKYYMEPTLDHEDIALSIEEPDDTPETELPRKALGFRVQAYGITKHKELFSKRQLLFLTTITNTLNDIYSTIIEDSKGNKQYADAVLTYLAFAIGRYSDYGSAMSYWDDRSPSIQKTFGLPTLQMRWGFPETNPFGNFSGNWEKMLEGVVDAIGSFAFESQPGIVKQADARKAPETWGATMISSDPPYYDNIGYAALSDYFYIWLRKSLGHIYPKLLSTILTPKDEELIAEPGRHNSNQEAAEYFEKGLFDTFQNAQKITFPNYPVTIYYAFKQKEIDATSSISPTGWEVFLSGITSAGYEITGTWPLRTEQSGGLRVVGRNALASSIVLSCKPRSPEATIITKREFYNMLRKELPKAIRKLQVGSIAPVDLAQASIGPGMAIFSRHKSVLEADGTPMNVRSALILINQALDEFLAEQEGEYGSDTRWALAWFEQYGHDQGPYGVAETLSKAKNTSVEGLSHAGFLEARGGKVRLLRRNELDKDWDPSKDKRLTAWEAAQYLIRTLDKEGEKGAGALLGKLGATGETARDLAYRLYTICERKGWAQEASAYNMLVVAWPRIKEQSGKRTLEQQQLL